MGQYTGEYTQPREINFLHPEQRLFIPVSRFLQTLVAPTVWTPSPQKLHFAFFFLLFYVLPAVMVLSLSDWGEVYRTLLAGSSYIFMIVYAVRYRHSWRDLGLNLDNLKPALVWFGIFTLGLTGIELFMHQIPALHTQRPPLYTGWTYLYYFLVSSPAQEFAYRGLLFAEMKRANVKNPWLQSLISGIGFAMLHLHMRDWKTILMTMFVGVVWGFLYSRTPNVWAAGLSHAILGALAFSLRLI